MNKKGSSETIREASVFNLQQFYESLTNSNLQHPTQLFLEWFIGFTEGDGSFGFTKFPTLYNPNNTRPHFVINQQEPQVLYKIKKSLGFGSVIQINDKKRNQQYYRYRVGRVEHLAHLLYLFNGNLFLNKTHLRFKKWVESYNTLCAQRQDLHHLKQYTSCISANRLFLKNLNLNSAWLAGFTDAEGGFYVSLCEDKKRKCTKLSFKYSIKQKGERDVLEKILILIRNLKDIEDNTTTFKTLKKGIYNVKGKKDTYALEVTKKTDLLFLTNYFDNYLLLSRNKRLVYVRWKRVLLRVRPYQKDTKAYKRYKRLVASVGKVRL